MMVIRLLLFIFFMSALSACGSENQGPSGPLFETGYRTKLEGGSWWSPCFKTVSVNNFKLKQRLQFFSDQSYTITTSYYEDNCQFPAYMIIQKGTFFLPFTGDEAKPIDLTINSISVRPRKGFVADSYSDADMCGIDKWTVNKDHMVAGLNCDGSSFPAAGTVSYELFLITQNPTSGFSFGDLRFGVKSGLNDGSTPARRPTQIQAEDLYFRK